MDLIELKEFKGNRHPWEISRRRSVLGLIKKYPRSACYADIGAGDLYFTEGLKRYTEGTVYAVDANFADEGDFGRVIRRRDLKDIPPQSADCIFMMDVLEHIEHDEMFLKDASVLLKDGGALIITVPAFDFLFSGHDMYLKHFRRYDHKRLVPVLRKCGFGVKEYFYFYISLFLARLLATFLDRRDYSIGRKDGIGNWPFGEGNPVTIFIKGLLEAEFFMSRLFKRAGITIPGLSLCLVCRKRSV